MYGGNIMTTRPPFHEQLRYERDKGSPLTESEVIEIRDKCTVVMLRRTDAAKMDERRGYADIAPEHCCSSGRSFALNLKKNETDAEQTGCSEPRDCVSVPWRISLARGR